ncbi:MAG: hypothetical protein ABT11_20290 [Novosphingobium sp. SCN 66-18]|nr:MAG: hypothetical protein ABT11_20290 [Novosphingobium sp. SCN 66-18]
MFQPKAIARNGAPADKYLIRLLSLCHYGREVDEMQFISGRPVTAINAINPCIDIGWLGAAPRVQVHPDIPTKAEKLEPVIPPARGWIILRAICIGRVVPDHARDRARPPTPDQLEAVLAVEIGTTLDHRLAE